MNNIFTGTIFKFILLKDAQNNLNYLKHFIFFSYDYSNVVMMLLSHYSSFYHFNEKYITSKSLKAAECDSRFVKFSTKYLNFN